MKKVINIISAIISLLLLGSVSVVGWYQAVQIIDFWPVRHGYQRCAESMPMLCSTYPERFGSIALGFIVSILFFWAIPLYLETTRKPVSPKLKTLIICCALVFIIIVHFSGAIIYRLSG